MDELDIEDVNFWIAITKKTDRKILTQVRIGRNAAITALRDGIDELRREDEIRKENNRE